MLFVTVRTLSVNKTSLFFLVKVIYGFSRPVIFLTKVGTARNSVLILTVVVVVVIILFKNR